MSFERKSIGVKNPGLTGYEMETTTQKFSTVIVTGGDKESDFCLGY